MNIFDTNVLVQTVPNLKTSQNFLLDRFFPNVVTSDTEFVSIDVDVGQRRMAPFVSPLVQGKLVESRRLQTNTFKPPYIKDKRAPDLRKPIRRQIGERIGGEYTAAEREMLNLQFEMADQIVMAIVYRQVSVSINKLLRYSWLGSFTYKSMTDYAC